MKITTGKGQKYYNEAVSVDIETSSFLYEGEKQSIVYSIAMAIGYEVKVMRTMEEFVEYLELIRDKYDTLNTNMIIYIHNLAYEFQFFKKYFRFDKPIALNTERAIISVDLPDFGMTFKCSYRLTGKPLSALAELTDYEKPKDFDYSLTRTPLTPLSSEELHYIKNDVLIINDYLIKHELTKNEINEIPLTATSKVRKYVRDIVNKIPAYKSVVRSITMTPNEYYKLNQAFQGGYTHGSIDYVGQIVENVNSIDLTSAYPWVMCGEKYPMSKARPIPGEFTYEQFKQFPKKHYLMRITLRNIMSKNSVFNMISESRALKCVGADSDNGRIMVAEEVVLYATEIDLEVYTDAYEFEEIIIDDVHMYESAYLPRPLVQCILKMYGDKTTLKGVEGKEEDYMLSKARVNSIYGMCVSSPIRDDFEFDEDGDIVKTIMTEEDCNKKIEKNNKSKKRFLSYAWGVWVTAYVRREVYRMMKRCDDTWVYTDTDSVKTTLDNATLNTIIEEVNKEMRDRLAEGFSERGLNPDDLNPIDINGEAHFLGEWDNEGDGVSEYKYEQFKTLGAKRYMYIEHGKLGYTISGLTKGGETLKYIKENGGLEFFTDGMYVPKEFTRKNTLTYIDKPVSGIVTDYLGQEYEYKQHSGIHMEGTGFHLSMSNQFIELINKIQGVTNEIL